MDSLTFGTANFLGVEVSVSGRRWRSRPADPQTVRDLQIRLGLSEPVARAMASRGVSAEAGESYLRPTLRALFPNPSTFADMDQAAGILVDAMMQDRRMVVFADYDVDGACSAALLVRWFRALGVDLPIYVPDRLTEGYGPTPQAMKKLRDAGADLVITVDCGAAALDALGAAADMGLDVVVIDHHLMGASRPPAAALVNPNRSDCRSGQGVLPAAGVTFVLLAALNREARARGLFADRPEPDLRGWLDLAALGSVCDVTQLVGFNRALTTLGLRAMAEWRNPGLAALMDVAGLPKTSAGVFEAGFILGPRINAGGRIGRADLGARLLSTDNLGEAALLARELDALNSERKDVERQIVDAATEAIEHGDNQGRDAPVLVVSGDDWHPGVIGIVASRLRERFHRPVVVIGVDRAGNIAKGSGRSQPGVNLGRAIQAAFDAGLLIAGGGHAMAAGLTLRPSAIPELREFLGQALADETAVARAEDALPIDVLISPEAAERSYFEDFQCLAPFGPGNPELMFALSDVRADRVFPMRGGHLRLDLVGANGAKLRAIAWRAEGGDLGRRLLGAGGGLHVAGRLRPNDWNGRRGVRLEIEDLADTRRV